MAISIKSIGRSVLESMLFLAVMGVAITFLEKFHVLVDSKISPFLYLPVLCAGASFVVAFAFPRPTYWRAFWKLFAGGILTFGIVAGLSIILGPTVFALILDFLWSTGGFVWDLTSGKSVLLGIFSIFFYIMITIILLGLVMALLFAITNFLVLLVMNQFVDQENVPQSTSNQEPLEPFN